MGMDEIFRKREKSGYRWKFTRKRRRMGIDINLKKIREWEKDGE